MVIVANAEDKYVTFNSKEKEVDIFGFCVLVKNIFYCRSLKLYKVRVKIHFLLFNLFKN